MVDKFTNQPTVKEVVTKINELADAVNQGGSVTIKQDGVTGATVNRFGTCSTGASTATKAVTITTGTWSLESGASVRVKFSYANTADTPKLKVNSGTAKNIFHKGSQITTGANKALLAGVCDFVYDGTQYHLVGNYLDTDTTYANGTGITIGNNNAINHSNSVTAGMAGTSSATSGSTLSVPYVTYDSQGHITASGTHTHTVTGFATTDTKNTAGSTDTSSKIFLIGATSQATNPQTYSHDTAFVDTSGRLNSAAPATDANDTTVATTKWVKDQGYTTNTGTITGITMNGSSKGTSGVVDLGTVITAHQDISGKQDKITSTNKLSADLVSDGTTNKTVTATEKTTWNNKLDSSAISDMATKTWVGQQGYTSNIGTVTSVNNIQPDANGNVAISATGGANIDLSNLSSTGQKVIDGQWVHSQYLAGSATAKGTYTVDLSSYLPSDSYNYEVMVNLRAYSSNSNPGSVYVYSDLWSKMSGDDYATQGAAGGYSRQISNTFIIPVGTEREIYYAVEKYALSNLSLILWGYRRIGTNQ